MGEGGRVRKPRPLQPFCIGDCRAGMALSDEDPALSAALARLAQPGMWIGHRIIADGDDQALLADELHGFAGSVAMVRRRSGAARHLARHLLAAAGFGPAALPRCRTGAPRWPAGVVGSLAHDDEVAVAAVAGVDLFEGIGIDVEPAQPLPRDLLALVATPAEIRRYPSALLESRMLFAIKEAVYKALNPIDGIFLDFQDICVDLDAGIARTRQNASIAVAFTASPRIVALAWLVGGQR